MWRMPGGNRVLSDSEWALFRAGLELLRDSIEEDIRGATEYPDSGVAVSTG